MSSGNGVSILTRWPFRGDVRYASVRQFIRLNGLLGLNGELCGEMFINNCHNRNQLSQKNSSSCSCWLNERFDRIDWMDWDRCCRMLNWLNAKRNNLFIFEINALNPHKFRRISMASTKTWPNISFWKLSMMSIVSIRFPFTLLCFDSFHSRLGFAAILFPYLMSIESNQFLINQKRYRREGNMLMNWYWAKLPPEQPNQKHRNTQM